MQRALALVLLMMIPAGEAWPGPPHSVRSFPGLHYFCMGDATKDACS
jgi:hypothetical protein